MPIRDEPFYTILLPEPQQMRSSGGWWPRARMQIADGQYDDAVETLKTGYALSRHVAAGPTLIHALVGMAIADMMNRQIEDLIQQPGAPNLLGGPRYRGRSSTSARYGGREECPLFLYPMLQDLERTDRGRVLADALQEFWREFLKLSIRCRLLRQPTRCRGGLEPAKSYPLASRCSSSRACRLKSRGDARAASHPPGIDPPPRAASRRSFQMVLRALRAARRRTSPGREQLNRYQEQQLEIIPIASMLLPALSAVRSTTVRSDRQITALQAVEAIRMHAARTGKLPAALAEVAPPVPSDPVTGKPLRVPARRRYGPPRGPHIARPSAASRDLAGQMTAHCAGRWI